jgi:phosphate/sulfate permease
MYHAFFRGFCVEWMAAVTVLVCGISKEFAIPVSTTHCQVGHMSVHAVLLCSLHNTVYRQAPPAPSQISEAKPVPSAASRNCRN